MTPKAYDLLLRCVEDGLMVGWRRAHKHTDAPDPETIRAAQLDAIALELDEWFTFPETD